MVCILHYGNSSLVSTDGISFNYSSLQEQLYWLSLNQSLEVSRKYFFSVLELQSVRSK